MTKAEIISRVLMDMGDVIGGNELRVLKDCLHRSLYVVALAEESTEITVTDKAGNEELLAKFLFERKIEGLSNATLLQYKRETSNGYSCFGSNTSPYYITASGTANASVRVCCIK